jgi:hypothetical protein
VARLALPMNHAALPRNAAQLKQLGVGYCNWYTAWYTAFINTTSEPKPSA